ncbi:MAG TPA: hypothetical protein VHF22_02535, partial [Planctomycetota bacterium]|nr:hypothetical protein [Planctomycetota bacterium]
NEKIESVKNLDATGLVHRLLSAHEAAFSIVPLQLSEVEAFVKVAEEAVKPVLTTLAASVIPIFGTVISALKAAKKGYDAANDQLMKGRVELAKSILRPDTPGAASHAVIERLGYYRNSDLAAAGAYTAQAIASVFDMGLASGPVGSLAQLAVTLHSLWTSYREKRDYEALMKAVKPYDALKASATMGAYVLMRYPAVGLVDPKKAQLKDLRETVVWGWLWNSKEAPKAGTYLANIGKAAKYVYERSPLKVQ